MAILDCSGPFWAVQISNLTENNKEGLNFYKKIGFFVCCFVIVQCTTKCSFLELHLCNFVLELFILAFFRMHGKVSVHFLCVTQFHSLNAIVQELFCFIAGPAMLVLFFTMQPLSLHSLSTLLQLFLWCRLDLWNHLFTPHLKREICIAAKIRNLKSCTFKALHWLLD